jgi:mannose-1-phosphate guanylyltransferase
VKAFLLAAGNGTRLQPLTRSVPKCLVPIRGMPLLGIWLRWCYRYDVEEVLINTHRDADAVCDYLAANHLGVRIRLSHEPELLGSAGTLVRNREFIADERRFAILYADVLTNADFSRMVAFHDEQQSAATIGVYHVAEPRQCGIVAVGENSVVTGFIEKPERPCSDLAFTGLMIATPAVLDEVPKKLPADVGFDLLPQLVKRMRAFTITDYLIDIGTMEKYTSAQVEWPGLPVQELGICSKA